MKKKTSTVLAAPLEGGHYAGRIHIGTTEYAIIVAPKAEGEHADTPWNGSSDSVKGALSLYDGYANTIAMAKAGSDLAKWARALRIGGHKDWYLPSQDELELCYRAFKPSAGENSLYSRSGINVSAVPPTYPYSVEGPKQTKAKEFHAGGVNAFDDAWYWSSTQRASISGCAWAQDFGGGTQHYWLKDDACRARAVRRLTIK